MPLLHDRLPARLRLPRRNGRKHSDAAPRKSAHSHQGRQLGIAGKQTGIYPIDSPGGWQLIGRTPLRLFTPEAERPTLIEAGYEVRFVPVSEEEYKKIEAEVAAGTYKPVLKGADAQ